MHSSLDKLLTRLLVDIVNEVDAVEGVKADFGFLPLLAFTGKVI